LNLLKPSRGHAVLRPGKCSVKTNSSTPLHVHSNVVLFNRVKPIRRVEARPIVYIAIRVCAIIFAPIDFQQLILKRIAKTITCANALERRLSRSGVIVLVINTFRRSRRRIASKLVFSVTLFAASSACTRHYGAYGRFAFVITKKIKKIM